LFVQAITMMAVFGVALRRGPVTIVTAFSTVALSQPVLATRSSFSKGSYQHLFARAFRPRSVLQSTTAAAEEVVSTTEEKLRKALEVEHPAYDVLKRDLVSEYGAYCTLYRHKKSGAELLSVSSDDDNKVFGIVFRTPPEEGNGIAHVLEHSVLVSFLL
jgi:hypothetical protein